MAMLFIFYCNLAFGDQTPDLVALEAFYGGSSQTTGPIKEPSSFRQMGTHTATTKKQAFISGVMEVGLPGVKDVQRVRRYAESIRSADSKKGLLDRLKVANRTEKAFDKKTKHAGLRII